MEFPQHADGVVTAPALELRQIRKRFGGVQALEGASVSVRSGSIHAMLGENGAGKTTLLRIAFGLAKPDAGTISVHGAPFHPKSPADAIHAGLGMVQQHFTLVPAMTALENVALGVSAGRVASDDLIRLSRQLGVALESGTPVGTLSVSAQQRVELLKALARGARLLILDEPTAALAPGDAEALFTWLRAFRERGGSVVLITHKLREALAIADEITVLRRGTVTWRGSASTASMDGLVSAMLGPSTPAGTVSRPNERPAPLVGDAVAEAAGLVVNDARGVPRVRDGTVRVHAGEILGVAGVEGSGSRELLHALAGRVAPIGGTLITPGEAGFMPEDRHDALLLDQSVADNIALRRAGRRRGWFQRAAAQSEAERLVERSGIRVDVRAPVSTLSGGNQQRLVLARELEGPPSLFVAMNPTRGLDVAAATEIHRRLREAAQSGMAVVYHTADLDELLDISHRIVVVFEGRVRAVTLDRAAVGTAMLGGA